MSNKRENKYGVSRTRKPWWWIDVDDLGGIIEPEPRRYSCWLCGREVSGKRTCLSCETSSARSIFEELDRVPNPYYVVFQRENDADGLAFQDIGNVDEEGNRRLFSDYSRN